MMYKYPNYRIGDRVCINARLKKIKAKKGDAGTRRFGPFSYDPEKSQFGTVKAVDDLEIHSEYGIIIWVKLDKPNSGIMPLFSPDVHKVINV